MMRLQRLTGAGANVNCQSILAPMVWLNRLVMMTDVAPAHTLTSLYMHHEKG